MNAALPGAANPAIHKGGADVGGGAVARPTPSEPAAPAPPPGCFGGSID